MSVGMGIDRGATKTENGPIQSAADRLEKGVAEAQALLGHVYGKAEKYLSPSAPSPTGEDEKVASSVSSHAQRLDSINHNVRKLIDSLTAFRDRLE